MKTVMEKFGPKKCGRDIKLAAECKWNENLRTHWLLKVDYKVEGIDNPLALSDTESDNESQFDDSECDIKDLSDESMDDQ